MDSEEVQYHNKALSFVRYNGIKLIQGRIMAYKDEDDTTTFMLKSLKLCSKNASVQNASEEVEQNANDDALVESLTEAPTCDMEHVLSQCLTSTSKKEEKPGS